MSELDSAATLPADRRDNMTNKDVRAIEKKFGIKLPGTYCQLITNLPPYLEALLLRDAKDGCESQIPFFLDRGMVEWTNGLVRGDEDDVYFEFDPNDDERPWPDDYFVIGSDVGGNYYCLKPATKTDRVYFWEQGCTSFMKYSQNIAGMVKKQFKLYSDLTQMDLQST